MVNIINGDYGGPGLGYHCFTESTPSDPGGQFPEYDLPGTTCAGQFDQFGRDPYVTHLAHPTHTSGGWHDQAMYNFNIEWELAFADLTASTSYFDRQTDYSEETSPRFSAGLRGLVNGAACFGGRPRVRAQHVGEPRWRRHLLPSDRALRSGASAGIQY